jgi:hypothetical protein
MSQPKRLTQEQISKLLEGQVDVLTPLAQKEQVFFRHSTCPTCNSTSHIQFINPKMPFSPGSPLPNILLRCSNCSTEFDPQTRIIITLPSPTGESG